MQESTSCPIGDSRLASPRLASLIVGLGLALASAANCQAQGTAPGTAPTIASPVNNSNEKFGTMITPSGGCSTDTYYLTLEWNYVDPPRGVSQTISSNQNITPANGTWSTQGLNLTKASQDNGSPTGVYSVRVVAYVRGTGWTMTPLGGVISYVTMSP